MSGTENKTISRKTALLRREFLGPAWMGALGLGLLKLAEVLGRTALPRHPEGTYGGEFEVGSLASLPKVTDPPLAYPEGHFWLIQTETGLLALYRAWTHLDCLVSWDDDSQKFICSCHGSEFSRQGDCQRGLRLQPAKLSVRGTESLLYTKKAELFGLPFAISITRWLHLFRP